MWLRKLLGLEEVKSQGQQANSGSPESIGDVLKHGGAVCSFHPNELSAEYKLKLLEVCRANPLIIGVWLAWLKSENEETSLLGSMVVEQIDERSFNCFVDQVNALDGPRFIAAVARGVPKSEPFYSRADA